MARSLDLQPEDDDFDEIDALIASVESNPEPPKPIINKPPQITSTHFREKLNAQQTTARKQLADLAEVIMAYPVYRLSYADCQFLMATIYSVNVRNQLSPGQIKSLEALVKKSNKAKEVK